MFCQKFAINWNELANVLVKHLGTLYDMTDMTENAKGCL